MLPVNCLSVWVCACLFFVGFLTIFQIVSVTFNIWIHMQYYLMQS